MDAPDDDAPAPTPPSPPTANPRYVYLVTRLRNRQITMEEATELFNLMQTMLRAAAVPPPTAPKTPTAITIGSSGPSGGPGGAGLGEDAYWISILALGAGAGLGAAVVKRLMGPPPKDPERTGARTAAR